MTTILRLAATMSAGAVAALLTVPAFGQADNTNSLTAPNWIGDVRRDPYYDSRQAYPYPYDSRPAYTYPYDSRQAYMEEAGRRWDAITYGQRPRTADIDRRYGYGYGYGYGHPYASGYPYASDWRAPRYYSPEPRRPYLGGPGVAVGRDSNPDDYATGIYNPKK